jgi:Fic family protein
MNKEDISPEKRDDWQEVQNYIKAMGSSIQALEKIPLSSRLLRETHAILMEGVRGEFKVPGEFRRSQNWIGGSNLSDAVYIPPHCDDLPELMSDLEYFWHNENINVPHLIKVAISHYQFETIHPFLDGNGRIGRLLITLYLVGFGLLIKPSLYLSDFFEKRRVSYYDALSRVRESNDLTHWIKFFLNAVIETAEKGKQTFNAILKLKNQIDSKIVNLNRRAENGRHLMQLLYRQPLVTINDAAKFLKISTKSANLLINEFIGLSILKEMTGQRRNRLFSFTEYVNLFSRD